MGTGYGVSIFLVYRALLFNFRVGQADHSIKKKGPIHYIYIGVQGMEPLVFFEKGRLAPGGVR